MLDPKLRFEAGDLLILETGEYSDLSYTDPLVVLKGFVVAEVVREFVGRWEGPSEDEPWVHGPQRDEFLPFLGREGYVEDVPNRVIRWNIGVYSEMNVMRMRNPRWKGNADD